MSEEAPNTIRVTRRYGVTPERIFDAWVEPAVAEQWLFTTPESEGNNYELDVRVGGSYTITDTRDGEDYMGMGEYLEVERPHRLVFTFGMPQFSPEFDRIIVDIAAEDGGCTLRLTQEGLPEGYEEATIDGWERMFDRLAVVLE